MAYPAGYHLMDPYDVNIAENLCALLPAGLHAKGRACDLKSRPEEYLYSYYKLGLLFEDMDFPMFNVFPLSSSSIPRHIPIDTFTAATVILGIRGATANLDIANRKLEYWGQLVNLNHHAFKKRGGMEFSGMIRSDGFSFSICLDDKGRERF